MRCNVQCDDCDRIDCNVSCYKESKVDFVFYAIMSIFTVQIVSAIASSAVEIRLNFVDCKSK